MLSRPARVLRRHGTSLELELSSPVGRCAGCAQACGLLALGAGFRASSGPCRLRISTEQDVAEGSEVALKLPAHELLRAALLAYGLPLVGLTAGGLLGALFWPASNDVAVLAGGVSGLLLALGVSRQLARAALLRPLAVELRSGG